MKHLLLPLGLLAACDGKSDPETEADTADTAGTDTPEETFPQGFGVGEQPPDFTLPDANGDMVSLSDYSGQRVVIVGTAAW